MELSVAVDQPVQVCVDVQDLTVNLAALEFQLDGGLTVEVDCQIQVDVTKELC